MKVVLRMRLKKKITGCGGCLVDLMAPLKVLVGKKCFLSFFLRSCFKICSTPITPDCIFINIDFYVQIKVMKQFNLLCKLIQPAKQAPTIRCRTSHAYIYMHFIYVPRSNDYILNACFFI